MQYFWYPKTSPKSEDLIAISNVIKNEFPNGPAVKEAVKPDREYTLNEIALNIREQSLQVSRSLAE